MDVHQPVLDDMLGRIDFAVSDVGVVVLIFQYLIIHDIINQVADDVMVDFFQTARGSFDGIAHHQYHHFLRKRVGPGISESQTVDIFIGLLFLLKVVKIAYNGRTMMRADKVDNVLRDAVLACNFNALDNMFNNDLRAVFGAKVLMRVAVA